MDNFKIDILLATYNGEKYIRKQLDSILQQSYENWILRIHDDGSSDKTVAIIKEYEKYDGRILYYEDSNVGLGSKDNFDLLMGRSNADFVLFADQDDIWPKNKLNQFIHYAEKVNVKNKPMMIFSNYSLIDSNDRVIRKCVMDKWEKAIFDTKMLLIDNPILGCAMMINKEMLDWARNIPKYADNHDQWIATLAYCCDRVFYIDEDLLFHRIHSNNVTLNTETKSCKERMKKLKKVILNPEYKMQRLINYLVEVIDRMNVMNSKMDAFKIYDLIDCILKRNKFIAIGKLIDNKYLLSSKKRTFLFLLCLLFLKRENINYNAYKKKYVEY